MMPKLDAVADKELRRVELEFQPAALACQGDALFAATKGAATVHVLDARTAQERAEIKLAGDPVRSLACHPRTGLLYYRGGPGGELVLFSPRSLVKKRSFPFPRTKPVESVFLGFGGEGKKVVCATLMGVHNKDEGVVLFHPTDGSAAAQPGSGEDETTTKPRARTRNRPGRSTS